MLLTIDLRTDAAAEVARLDAARLLARPPDAGNSADPGDDVTLAQLDGDGAWIIAARSPSLRRALAGRALMLWRVTCEDASGRLVESRLVAIAVSLSPRTRMRRRAHVVALVSAMERETVALVERCSDDWRIAVDRTTQAFASRRAARVGAIALEGRDAARSLFQPGLFDRRAARPAGSTVARSDAIVPGAAVRSRPQLRLVVVP
jgi:hypothetical protein